MPDYAAYRSPYKKICSYPGCSKKAKWSFKSRKLGFMVGACKKHLGVL
jgi:hypothetical protein